MIGRTRGGRPASLLLAALAGCTRPADPEAKVEVAHRWAVPAADEGAWCADVDDARFCWAADGQPLQVPRALPPRAPPTPPGFRCTGQGLLRSCAARDDAEPFACDGAVCTQGHPRQPDDGPWRCSDEAGVTVCVGGEVAAFPARAPEVAGWQCGRRRRTAERVCVDLSPDFPAGSPRQQRCRWSYDQGVVRTCTRDSSAHVLGDPCDGDHPCVAGARCASGRCAPGRPAANCIDDSDCEGGRCRFGSCTAGP